MYVYFISLHLSGSSKLSFVRTVCNERVYLNKNVGIYRISRHRGLIPLQKGSNSVSWVHVEYIIVR